MRWEIGESPHLGNPHRITAGPLKCLRDAFCQHYITLFASATSRMTAADHESGPDFSRADGHRVRPWALAPAKAGCSKLVHQLQTIVGPSKSALIADLPTRTANANTAGKSSGSKSGYSSRIVSCMPPVANNPKTSQTVIRIPRMDGCPERFPGSIVMRDPDAVSIAGRIRPPLRQIQ